MRYLKSPVPTIGAIADLPDFLASADQTLSKPSMRGNRGCLNIGISILFTCTAIACGTRCRRQLVEEIGRGMADTEDLHVERLVLSAYDERVKELFKVFAEGLAQG